MPALSPTMETGKIQKWNYKVGDEVVIGDSLADIETDKSTVAFEMIDDGYIAKLLYEEGDTDVPVGQWIAIIVENKEDIESFKNYSADIVGSTPNQENDKVKNSIIEPVEQVQVINVSSLKEPIHLQREKKLEDLPNLTLGQGENRISISPIAKRLAIENNIAFLALKSFGTGENGRILAENVETYLNSQSQKQKAEVQIEIKDAKIVSNEKNYQLISPLLSNNLFEEIPVTQFRKVTAKRL